MKCFYSFNLKYTGILYQEFAIRGTQRLIASVYLLVTNSASPIFVRPGIMFFFLLKDIFSYRTNCLVIIISSLLYRIDSLQLFVSIIHWIVRKVECFLRSCYLLSTVTIFGEKTNER